jgi:hypothetical protein
MGKKAEERKIITSWAIHTQWTIQNDPLSLYVSLFNWGDVASILISSLLFFLLLGALPFIWKGAKRLWTRTHTHTQTNSAGAAAAASDFQSGAIRGRSVGFSNKWSGRQTETYWKKKEGWCGMFVGVFLLRPHTTHIFPCYPNTNCWCSFNGTARERERERVVTQEGNFSPFQQRELSSSSSSAASSLREKLFFKLHRWCAVVQE